MPTLQIHNRQRFPALPLLALMLVQLAAYVVVKLLIPSLTEDIPANKTSTGFFLGTLSLGVGLLYAACMSY